MKTITTLILAAGLMVTGSTLAADMPATAKKNNCTACHTIDKKMVGPAWADVSKKYKGDAGAADRLNAKIAKGGKGVWGNVPMPPYANVNDAERKELVDFILGLAK